MAAQPNAPYTWSEIEKEVRTAVMRQLNSLAFFGPDGDEVTRRFAGVESELLDAWLSAEEEQSDNLAETFPVERHGIYRVVHAAYHYAYQTDDWFTATSETFHLGSALLEGAYAMANADGEPSPLAKINDPPLRRVLETFVARWKLSNTNQHSGLTVRELALLSNMTVPAVRTSLSKEGFKLEVNYRADAGKEENGVLNEEEALVWLSRRRGFVPTRTDRPTETEPQLTASVVAGWLNALPFPDALQRTLAAAQEDTGSLASALTTDPAWMEGLIAGRSVAIDIEQLRKLAQHLCADEAAFVGKAVQHLISAERVSGSAPSS